MKNVSGQLQKSLQNLLEEVGVTTLLSYPSYVTGSTVRDVVLFGRVEQKADIDLFVLEQASMDETLHRIESLKWKISKNSFGGYKIDGARFLGGLPTKEKVLYDLWLWQAKTPEEALGSVDFGINAVAYCPFEKRFVMHPRFNHDLEDKIIKPLNTAPLEPDLNAVRAVRLARKLGFSLDRSFKGKKIEQKALFYLEKKILSGAWGEDITLILEDMQKFGMI